MSQAELARACGVKPPSVNGWLNGKAKFLRGENLLAAASALGVSRKWLATGAGDMLTEEFSVDELRPFDSQPKAGITQSPEEIEAGFPPGMAPEPLDAILLIRLVECMQRAAVSASAPHDLHGLLRMASAAYPIYKGRLFDDDALVRRYARAFAAHDWDAPRPASPPAESSAFLPPIPGTNKTTT